MTIADAIAFCALMFGIICVVGIMFDAYKHRLTNRAEKLELEARIAEAQASARLASGSDIEERLRVLERIATDRGHMIADEIEALRFEAAKDRIEA